MIIGKYVIKRAKTIRVIIQTSKTGTEQEVARMLQIYSCRFCGICFYRTEITFINERKAFFDFL
jgi:hypothetical protein